MTTIAPAAGPEVRRGPARAVRWRPLILAAVRQHRAALISYVILAAVLAVALAVTGLVLHAPGPDVFAVVPHSRWHLFDVSDTTFRLMLPLMPVVAGMFLGAPLVSREIENGTTRFAWAQGTGQARWLIAQLVPMTLLLVVIAVGLGLQYRWWADPLLATGWPWRSDLFGFQPLPFAGWTALGLALGVSLGAAIRRALPAMAATLACLLPLMYGVLLLRRHGYLPPLRRPAGHPSFSVGGGYGWTGIWRYGRGPGPGPEYLGSALGWPDGRLLSQSELHHSPGWFRLHHIQVWLSYQPASRFGLFELIEFGGLVILAALLVAATVVIIRRGAA